MPPFRMPDDLVFPVGHVKLNFTDKVWPWHRGHSPALPEGYTHELALLAYAEGMDFPVVLFAEAEKGNEAAIYHLLFSQAMTLWGWRARGHKAFAIAHHVDNHIVKCAKKYERISGKKLELDDFGYPKQCIQLRNMLYMMPLRDEE